MTEKKGNQGVAVGDVFISSWGWEQTNIDYYQVVRIVGKTMIELREISKTIVNSLNDMSCDVKPVADSFVGGKIKKKVHHYSDDPSVSLTSFSSARLLRKLDNGEYPTANQTSYA